MDNSDSTSDYYLISSSTFASPTTTCGTTFVISDKDWMPYTHFEYDPLWHKKFASIKYQMDKMWK